MVKQLKGKLMRIVLLYAVFKMTNLQSDVLLSH